MSIEFECTTLFFIFLITVLVAYILNSRQKTNLPPGPTPYPVVGNILLMKKGKLVDIYRRLRTKYGDIFKLQMGPKTFIVFSGYDVLRDAFVKRGDIFSHRPDISTMRLNKGIIANSGESWKRTRTFTLNALRDFGFGRKSLQSRVIEEVEVFIHLISRKNSKPFDVSDIVFPSVSNVICSIVFGDRFDHSDERFKLLIKILNEKNARLGSFVLSLRIFPFFKWIPEQNSNGGLLAKNRGDLFEFFRSQIQIHKETYDEGNIRDVIDAFLKEEKTNPDNIILSEDNLINTVYHLFAAGTETTSTAIRWAILYMIHYPLAQDKMRAEIERVVGSSRTPTMEDQPQLPYCEAFIYEVLRFANLTPNALPHGVSEDTTFRGFYIPEKAVLIMNLDSVLNDPDLFSNPDQFNPSRFIGKDGNITGYEKVVVFSLGRRICLGKALARMELFLFMTSLVQRFRMKPPHPDKLPSKGGILGIVLSPRPYEVIAETV